MTRSIPRKLVFSGHTELDWNEAIRGFCPQQGLLKEDLIRALVGGQHRKIKTTVMETV
jgi:hypothetical protein